MAQTDQLVKELKQKASENAIYKMLVAVILEKQSLKANVPKSEGEKENK